MAKSKILIEYMVRRLEEVGAIKIKQVDRTDVDEARVTLAEPLDVSKLYAVEHLKSRYYPDGLAGNYVEIEYTPKSGDTVIHANVH